MPSRPDSKRLMAVAFHVLYSLGPTPKPRAIRYLAVFVGRQLGIANSDQATPRKTEGTIDAQADTEALREFALKGEYKLRMSAAGHLDIEFNSLAELPPLIEQRNWVLAKAAQSQTGYVTSDRPVSLIWRDPKEHFGAPGLAHLDTELIFPISNDLAVIGAFEAKNIAVNAPADFVARVNSVTIGRSNRQIYARDQDFKYLSGPDAAVREGHALVTDPFYARITGGGSGDGTL